MVKNLPAMQETWVQFLSQEDHLEKGMATYSQYSGLENPMDRGVGYSQWGGKESDTTEQQRSVESYKLLDHGHSCKLFKYTCEDGRNGFIPTVAQNKCFRG